MIKRLACVAGLALGLTVLTAQPASALGGECNGLADLNCRDCYWVGPPPRQADPRHCANGEPGYEWGEACTLYSDVVQPCIVG